MAGDTHDRLKRFRSPDGINVILGAWLVITAVALPHTLDEAMVTMILGILIALSSAASYIVDNFHYVDAIFAVLLGVCAAVLPAASTATRINQGAVAIAVFVFSLMSDRGERRFLRRFDFRRHGR
jgi:hypothetical protein